MNQDAQWLLKEKYKGAESTDFVSDLKRLQEGEPLAYLIGHVPFLDCKIYLDSQPLIPRTETEYWTNKAIEEIENVAKKSSTPFKILDLCAGSGCIGIAVAKAIPNTQVHFAEINKDHLSTIEKNLETNDISSKRTEMIQSDLFENIKEKYDFILSNPPYINPQLDRVENSVKNFEPHEALYSEDEGLFLIKEILKTCSQYLIEEGILYLEHEPEQTNIINSFATQNKLRALSYTDQYGTLRYTRLKQS